VAAGVAFGLVAWSSAGAAAGTIPPGARVVTVTPVFGRDPNTSRHHLDHALDTGIADLSLRCAS